jgi:site-specific recombinase XerC
VLDGELVGSALHEGSGEQHASISRGLGGRELVAAAVALGDHVYTGDDDLVVCHPHSGRPYDASKSRVRFKDALKRASLRPLRFHDLRHTYGTRIAAAGTPLRTLQGWMGHRDYKTTEIYADFAPDPTQGALWARRAFGDEPLEADTSTESALRRDHAG